MLMSLPSTPVKIDQRFGLLVVEGKARADSLGLVVDASQLFSAGEQSWDELVVVDFKT